MKIYFTLSALLCFIFTFACKHDHPPVSAELREAFEIQKQGLDAIKKIEAKLSDNTTTDNRRQQLRLEQYKTNMIEIEGLQHDHSQCNGDHSKKRFSIPDKEMITVQKEWRDSILSILNTFDK